MTADWSRGNHALIDEREVARALRLAIGRELVSLQQHPAKPPRVIYEASFNDHAPVIFKAEVTLPDQTHDIALEGWALEQAARAGVLVPAVLAQDSSEAAFPFRYLIMSRLEGTPLEAVMLPDDQQQRLFAAVGDQLVRLHGIELDGYGWLDEELYLTTGRIRGIETDWRASTVIAGYETLRRLAEADVVSSEDASALERRLIGAGVPEKPDGRLLNGDFDSTQIFVRDDGTLSGFIDFGDREAGPREWEFSTVLLWDEPLLEGLLAGYEGALGRPVDRDLVPVYTVAKLLQILRRRLDRNDLQNARQKAADLLRFV
jgi:aminoglycoside phosphotransferase (APT) family kinase protein